MARYQNGSVRSETEIRWSNVGLSLSDKRDPMERESSKGSEESGESGESHSGQIRRVMNLSTNTGNVMG